MSFRDNLQHLRATHAMTQEQLALMLGVSRQSVTKWEAEKSYPEMDKLLKLCQIFDVTLDDLVQGDLTTSVPTAAVASARRHLARGRRWAASRCVRLRRAYAHLRVEDRLGRVRHSRRSGAAHGLGRLG